MSKRILSVLMILSILVAAIPALPASAETRASEYVSGCYAQLSPGSGSGELKLTYQVTTGKTGIVRIGIVALFVYRPDGTIARVVSYNASNGLIKSGVTNVRSTYTIRDLDPGQTYYCSVRFLVEDAYGSDTQYYSTNTAVTPR